MRDGLGRRAALAVPVLMSAASRMPKMEPNTMRRRAALRAEDDPHREPRQRVGQPRELAPEPAGLAGAVARARSRRA